MFVLYNLFFLADVRVFSFNLILSVDYLLTVADFFTSSMKPEETEGQSDQIQAINIPNVQSAGTSTTMIK